MDPRRNPYAPGAGTPPPELAGRDGTFHVSELPADVVKELGTVAVPAEASAFAFEYNK